ncbi:MAG: ExeM/NucH family extracellular endonuclease, partial [Pseudomonadota bacterium]
FALANWRFSGPNALDGETGNDSAATPFPIGTFTAAAQPIVINEVLGSTDGGDTEFVELFGPAGASLDGLSIIVVESDDQSSNGAIDRRFDFAAGTSLGDNGFFLLGNDTEVVDDFGVTPDAIIADNFIENSSYTLALVETATITGSGVTGGETVIDAVTVIDEADEADDGFFDAPVVGPDGTFLPAGVVRDPSATGGFRINDSFFTPGEATPTAASDDGGGGGDDPTARLISEIQGSGAASPFAGERVIVTAVVTADFQDAADSDLDGFYLQEEDSDSDGDAATSEGIFVFQGNASVGVPDLAVGDLVTLTGTVDEFGGETQIDEITAIEVVSSANQDLVTPASIVADPDTGFLVAGTVTDAGLILPDYEAVEGMLVTFPDTLTVSDVFGLGRYNEVGLNTGGRIQNFTQANAPDIAAFEQFQQDVARRAVVIDDAFFDDQNRDPIFPAGGLDATSTLRAGDTLTDLTGVVTFREEPFAEANYRVVPTVTPDFVSTNPRPETPPDVGSDFTVASFNVLNFFETIDTNVGSFNGPNITGPAGDLEPRGAESEDGVFTTDPEGRSEFDRQLAKLVEAITAISADIVGLIEIENDVIGDTVTAIGTLVDALNAAGPVVYDFVDTGPIEGAQGGPVEGDAIKVGFIYDTATVAPNGDFAILDETVDPRFETVGTQRPALAQTFSEIGTGADLTVAVNHFKSKGSVATYDDDADPTTAEVADTGIGDGQANNPNIRTNAAEALVDWLATDPTASGDPDFLIIGDLNAYLMEDAIQAVLDGADDTRGTDDDYVTRITADDYSFGFPVDLDAVPYVQTYGTLDYALATRSLDAQITGLAEWHINADEPAVLDYNLNFQSDAQRLALFGEDPFRASDHDPLIVGLDLTPDLVATDDTAETGHCDPVTIDVLANDLGDAIAVSAVDDSATEGTVTANADGTIDYDPAGRFAYLAAGESATDSFLYTVADAGGTAEAGAEVTVTVTGPEGDTDTGSPFALVKGTNGGINVFGFNGDDFVVRGKDVRGRETFDDVDPLLVRSAFLFDGDVLDEGVIDDQVLDDGAGPNSITVNGDAEVEIAGDGIEGSYLVAFDTMRDAENFGDFVERLFDRIDRKDVVATDADDFRFDAGPARLFFDKQNGAFGVTLDGGETQARFSTLETFVEGVVEVLGGEQTRDGDFRAGRIADGRGPTRVEADDDGELLIAGRGVKGRFEFTFEDGETAGTAADALSTLFDEVAAADAIGFGDLLV